MAVLAAVLVLTHNYRFLSGLSIIFLEIKGEELKMDEETRANRVKQVSAPGIIEKAPNREEKGKEVSEATSIGL